MNLNSKIVKYVYCLLAILVIHLFSTESQAVQTDFDDLIISRITQNLSKLRSYKGIVVQKGVIDKKDLKAEVYVKKPHLFLFRVLEPKAFEAARILYRDSTLLYYYPNISWALRIKNLHMPSKSQLDQIIADNYRKSVKNFDSAIGQASSVANLPVIALSHKARYKKLFNRSGKTLIYERYSFPLAGEMTFIGDVRYSYRYQKIEFNIELPDSLFAISLAKNTTISELDLDSSPIPISEMKKAANFQFSLPAKNPLGLERYRIIKQKGIVPAFAVYYRQEPYFAIIFLVRDYGIQPEEGYGIPIQTSKKGRLIVSPAITSFSFVHNGAYYTLMGNLPFEDILEFSNYID